MVPRKFVTADLASRATTRFVATRISGGIGNQLFQFAMGLQVSQQNKRQLRLLPHSNPRPFELGEVLKDDFEVYPTSRHSGRFDGLLSQAPARWIGGEICKQIRDPGHHKMLPLSDLSSERSIFLNGYWQSENYFSQSSSILRAYLLPRIRAAGQPTALPNGPWLSIHLRRGDLESNPSYNKRYGVLNFEYYRTAIAKILDKDITIEEIVIFSDSPLPNEIHLLEQWFGIRVTSANSNSAWCDLAAMTLASAHVCANSTFSWWGAWLAASEYVVFPAKPFADPQLYGPYLCPPAWLRV